MNKINFRLTGWVLCLFLVAGVSCSRRELSSGEYRDLAQGEAVKGKHKRAIRYYKRALRAEAGEEERGRILCEIGLSYYKLERFQEAITTIDEGLLFCPDYATAHGVLGLSYHALHPVRFREKIKFHLNRYIELEPDNPIVPGFKDILTELEMLEEAEGEGAGERTEELKERPREGRDSAGGGAEN